MTGVVRTICMRVSGCPTLMANRYDIRRDALATAFVKDKVFTDNFIFSALLLAVGGIFNNASFELMYIFKSFVLEPS